jgi:hypothetical protein
MMGPDQLASARLPEEARAGRRTKRVRLRTAERTSNCGILFKTFQEDNPKTNQKSTSKQSTQHRLRHMRIEPPCALEAGKRAQRLASDIRPGA